MFVFKGERNSFQFIMKYNNQFPIKFPFQFDMEYLFHGYCLHSISLQMEFFKISPEELFHYRFDSIFKKNPIIFCSPTNLSKILLAKKTATTTVVGAAIFNESQ